MTLEGGVRSTDAVPWWWYRVVALLMLLGILWMGWSP